MKWLSSQGILFLVLTLPPTLAVTHTRADASVSNQAFGPSFAISASPTTGDWQRFHTLSEQDLKQLWSFHQNKKLTLKDWSWQWRLGWLRACGLAGRKTWCNSILKDGLNDDALVVRAEAANQFGLAKKKTATTSDIAALATAYQRPDNFRNGKPLFVCERILDALATIEHPRAAKVASTLAKKHTRTIAYWRSRSASKKMPH